MDLQIKERMPDSREFQTCGETDGQTEHRERKTQKSRARNHARTLEGPVPT